MIPPSYQNKSSSLPRSGTAPSSRLQRHARERDADGKPKMEPFLTGFLLDEKPTRDGDGQRRDGDARRLDALSDDQNRIIYR